MCAGRGSANCRSLAGMSMPAEHAHVCCFPWLDLNFLFFFLYFFSCTSQFRNCLKYQIVGFSTWVSWSPPPPPTPPSFGSTGRQRGTALCVLVPILSDIFQLFLWGYTASCLPVVHSVVGWFHMSSACLYVNEQRMYWLSFCSAVSEFISISNLFSHIRCGFAVV